MTTTIHDIHPVSLTIQDVSGSPRVFYDSSDIGSELDDIFDDGTSVTAVTFDVTNQASYTVDVQFDRGATQPLSPNGGSTSQDLTMPAEVECNSMSLYVWREGQLHHDPLLKLKQKQGTRVPNC